MEIKYLANSYDNLTFTFYRHKAYINYYNNRFHYNIMLESNHDYIGSNELKTKWQDLINYCNNNIYEKMLKKFNKDSYFNYTQSNRKFSNYLEYFIASNETVHEKAIKLINLLNDEIFHFDLTDEVIVVNM